MTLKNYSTVILLTDRFKEEGVKTGDIGTIIEVYNNGEAYEVDFSNEKGITIAQIVVLENELKLQEPS